MKKKIWTIFLLLLAIGCKKPYNPPAITAQGSYLVVEGIINAGPDSTIIKLSRTVNLSAASTVNPETGATVAVEGNDNTRYPLTETSTGKYAAAGLNLNNAKQYRLSIKTANNQQYLSAFVPVSITPPIDSVGFTVQANGMQIYLNTHDPNNNTHYYRWDYSETWQFHSLYESEYITNGQAIVPRTISQQNYSCFGHDTSSSITLGSSAQLKQDVIYQAPITTVASTSEKLETKYSILVQQYALTGDAYNFWTNLKKNTENLGSIFDAEPSNINGNIHNVANSSEPVIGYISASTVQSKRVFITSGQLPHSFNPAYPYSCQLDTNWYVAPVSLINEVQQNLIPIGSPAIPVSAFYGIPAGPSIIAFFSSSIQCVDCTIRGTTVQPPFWK
jgi:hypothetical protein